MRPVRTAELEDYIKRCTAFLSTPNKTLPELEMSLAGTGRGNLIPPNKHLLLEAIMEIEDVPLRISRLLETDINKVFLQEGQDTPDYSYELCLGFSVKDPSKITSIRHQFHNYIPRGADFRETLNAYKTGAELTPAQKDSVTKVYMELTKEDLKTQIDDPVATQLIEEIFIEDYTTRPVLGGHNLLYSIINHKNKNKLEDLDYRGQAYLIANIARSFSEKRIHPEDLLLHVDNVLSLDLAWWKNICAHIEQMSNLCDIKLVDHTALMSITASLQSEVHEFILPELDI